MKRKEKDLLYHRHLRNRLDLNTELHPNSDPHIRNVNDDLPDPGTRITWGAACMIIEADPLKRITDFQRSLTNVLGDSIICLPAQSLYCMFLQVLSCIPEKLLPNPVRDELFQELVTAGRNSLAQSEQSLIQAPLMIKGVTADKGYIQAHIRSGSTFEDIRSSLQASFRNAVSAFRRSLTGHDASNNPVLQSLAHALVQPLTAPSPIIIGRYEQKRNDDLRLQELVNSHRETVFGTISLRALNLVWLAAEPLPDIYRMEPIYGNHQQWLSYNTAYPSAPGSVI